MSNFKRIVSLLCIASILLSFLFSLVSCDKNSENKVQGISYLEANVAKAEDVNFYEINVNSTAKFVTSFCDGVYNYFYYKLGEVYNVPTYYSNLWNFYGFGEQTLTIENSQSVTSTIEKSTSTCISNTVDSSYAENMNFSPTLHIGDELALSVISHGLQQSGTTSNTLSTDISYTQAVSESLTHNRARSLTLRSGDPVGSYRFMILSDVEVFGLIRYDLDSKKTTYTYMLSVKDDATEGWFYGEKRDLSIDSNYEVELEDKLKFSAELIGDTDFGANLDNHQLVRRKVAGWSDIHTTWAEAKVSGWYIGDLMNLDTINTLGINKVKITIKYTTVTPSGECKAIMKAFLSYNNRNSTTKLGEKSATASGKRRSYSETYEIDITRFMSSDGWLGVEYHSENDGWLDLLKNQCNFVDITYIVELVK